jgi:8-oxo-dGTP diphosphatase
MIELPYIISTLIYIFNSEDQVLLLKRAKEPNRGLWSPCGGKLAMSTGESPYACACREAKEETGMEVEPSQLHLTGLISEQGYANAAHWLMFLFEVKPKLDRLPLPIEEGQFGFFYRAELERLAIPETDRESIWPRFWAHRSGFFAARCQCSVLHGNQWLLEESRSL